MALIPNKQKKIEDYEGQLAVDVYEENKHLVILAPIAGVKIKDIHVSVTDNILKIEGERMVHNPQEKEKYLIQECFWGAFSREIILPNDIDTSQVSAKFKDGILEITIPKTFTHTNSTEIKIT